MRESFSGPVVEELSVLGRGRLERTPAEKKSQYVMHYQKVGLSCRDAECDPAWNRQEERDGYVLIWIDDIMLVRIFISPSKD